MTTGRESGPRGLARNLALAAASALLFLVLAEGLATLVLGDDVGPPAGTLDAVVGFRLRANHTYTEVGGAEVTTNSRGFRDDELPEPRPSGGLRILALGDSSTFGYGVRREETYPARLERALAGRFPGRAIEVLNAGTPGWSSGNGAAFLASEGLSWKPDIVLVSFGYNEQLGSGPGAPHYDYNARAGLLLFHTLGEAVRSRPSGPEPDARQRAGLPGRFESFPRNLRLYLLLQRGMHALEQGTARLYGGLKSSRLAAYGMGVLYRREPELVYRPLRVAVKGNHVLEAYVAHLEEMVRICRDAGVKVVFVLQPRRAHQELLDLLPAEAREGDRRAVALIEAGSPEKAVAMLTPLHDARPQDAITAYLLALALQLDGRDAPALALLETLLPLRPFTLNALMQEVAIRRGVPIVPTPLSFAASRRRDLFFSDRYHTRPPGYALVADAVEKTLVEEGLLGSGEEADR